MGRTYQHGFRMVQHLWSCDIEGGQISIWKMENFGFKIQQRKKCKWCVGWPPSTTHHHTISPAAHVMSEYLIYMSLTRLPFIWSSSEQQYRNNRTHGLIIYKFIIILNSDISLGSEIYFHFSWGDQILFQVNRCLRRTLDPSVPMKKRKNLHSWGWLWHR